MQVTRLRQVVVVAHDRDAIAQQLQESFGFGAGFADPGVAEFGLHNWVIPAGDTFIEVVAPTEAKTTAGRYLQRHGEAGYMVIFQVANIGAARDHLRAEHCRTVWSGDFPAISGTHLHPVDIGGAIVSVDEPRPPESWMWAGPDWTNNVKTGVARSVCGVVMADPDPDALAARWAKLLCIDVVDRQAMLPDGSTIEFVDSIDQRVGLVCINLAATNPANAGRTAMIANVEFTLR